ncbi:MAG: cytochrome c [Reichenbachiella sp.]
MNKRYLTILVFAVFTCGIVACGGEKKPSETQVVKVEKKVSSSDALLKKGETVYKSYCMACHMSKGQGVPNLNPPLTRTKYTLGDKKVMIKIVLNGLNEEIEVLGEKYNSVMTPFNFLSDEEIAGVITFVRQNFGNDADAASIEEVAEVRSSMK